MIERARALPVTLVVVGLLLAGGAPLVLERPTLASFFLCHFAHLSLRHLFFSGLATVLLGAAVEWRLGSARFAALLAAIVFGVSAGVLASERGRLADYCGASGIGYALAAALAVQQRRNVSIAILGFLAVKVGYEFLTGRCLVDVSLEAAGAVPVPMAHAIGLAIGSLGGSLLQPAEATVPSAEGA